MLLLKRLPAPEIVPLKLPLWMVRVLVTSLMVSTPEPDRVPMEELAEKLTDPVELLSREAMLFVPVLLTKFSVELLITVPRLLLEPPTLMTPSWWRVVPARLIVFRFRVPTVSLVSEPLPVMSAPAPLPALTVTRTSEPLMLSVPPDRRVMKEEGPEPCRVRLPPLMVPTEILLVAVAVAVPPKVVTRAWTPFKLAVPPVKLVIVVDWPLKECVPPVRWVIFTSAEVEVMAPPSTLVNSPRVPVRLTWPFSRVTTSAVPAKFTVPKPSTLIRPTVAEPETFTLRKTFVPPMAGPLMLRGLPVVPFR